MRTIQNKLLSYETRPSETVWQEVANALDRQAEFSFAGLLYEFEQAPGENSWERINSLLGHPASGQGEVIPFFTRYRRPIKYSGAAAVFIFLAVTSSLFISKKTGSEEPVNSGVLTSHPKINNISSPATVMEDLAASTEPPARQLSAKQHGSYYKPARSALKVRPVEAGSSLPSLDHLFPKFAERHDAISYNSPYDHYMIYSDGDGNAVRLPKKLFDSFACTQRNFLCKERLKKLQERMAASALSSDFAGILEILNNLGENQ